MTGPIVPTNDRLWGPFRALVNLLVAPTRFYGRYEYTITNPSTSTVDCTPNDPSLGLPDLNAVTLTSDSISTYTPPSGGTCHIQFVDGNPAKPICVWTDGTATVVNVMGGSQPVARQGDQVQCFLPPTLPIVGTLSGGPFTSGVITVANPISGSITGGSATVNSA